MKKTIGKLQSAILICKAILYNEFKSTSAIVIIKPDIANIVKTNNVNTVAYQKWSDDLSGKGINVIFFTLKFYDDAWNHTPYQKRGASNKECLCSFWTDIYRPYVIGFSMESSNE